MNGNQLRHYNYKKNKGFINSNDIINQLPNHIDHFHFSMHIAN